ncbi:helix-turn-helix transcriptional regulator [Acidocella sp.]|uniref:helix-turn-helix transcriptional regulator n=1 Tax=Acidocella sp. TaxID=50710 RepID=UPI003D00A177
MFYWVDGDGMADVSLTGLPPQFAAEYAARMEQADPSNVHRLVATGASVTHFSRPRPEFSRDALVFGGFLNRYGAVDVIDLLFRAGGDAVAGIGIIKMRGDAAAGKVELAQARAIQRFVEFGLQGHERVLNRLRPGRAMRAYRLTRREWEIADMAAQGVANREIAARLGLSTHTVKSHLLHVFCKTGSANRTALAAKLYL